jgi:hypothetical protein
MSGSREESSGSCLNSSVGRSARKIGGGMLRRLKESRQQEQFNHLLQIAMTGMMAYMTASQQKR